MFDPAHPQQSFPDLEKGIQQYWEEEDIFKRSIRQRADEQQFSFYDGPPFATGLPHYGHLLAGTIKDVIPRYQTMRGRQVQRRFGWDCHGLPVENLVEQEESIKDRREIEAMGTGEFCQLCCKSVQRYTKEWRQVVERMGRWVDMDWDYRTMDPEYMESIWWVVNQLNEKGLLYEGHRPMHVCPRCVTPLSNFEVTQAYKDVTDSAVTVQFELEDQKGTYVLAWTTTPWTLPGNLLLAVGQDIRYAKVECEGRTYILATSSVEKTFEGKEYKTTGTVSGKTLAGKHYKPLFPYFIAAYRNNKHAFRIVTADFVATDEGTGIVHIAPGFGEDDFGIGQREGLELLQHVTMDGKFVPEVTDFAGQSVKPVNDPAKTDRTIIKWLEERDLLFSKATYKHSYPHCWRCDSPLLNYATASWFVKVEVLKEKLLANNAKTKWVPEHMRDGRFGRWLENARDWAISRNRYWGTPLPIWRNTETGDIEIVESRDELMRRALVRFSKITVLRHGESEGNLAPIYQGQEPGTDLTERGRQQAQAAGELLVESSPLTVHSCHLPVDIIYCSPLARTRQTAQAVADATGANVIVDERLREVAFGEYEGKTIDFSDLAFVKAKRAHKMQKNAPESIYHFPGMETWNQVQERINDFLTDILHRHRSQHVVIVTHADPVQNIKHFFAGEDPMKISRQPYPQYADPHSYYWDHDANAAMDLHKHAVDSIVWHGPATRGGTSITLARHGQTDANKDGLVQGNELDLPLNAEGKAQAQALAATLKGKKFDAILCSPLARARETAETIATALGTTVTATWDDLTERSSGDWNGKTLPDVMAQFPGALREVTPAFHHATPPNGESLSQFLQRMAAVRDRLLAEYAGKRVLIVCHQGVNQGLRAIMENLSYREAVTARLANSATYTLKLGNAYRRVPEVLDCWFESGSMPYAQAHFPFANVQRTALQAGDGPHGFPADFIAEGVDQTRGWFYTLMVLSSALFNAPAFRHCIVNGIVLAEDGKKMSKRLKNYPEPTVLIDKYGADAIRFTLMSSPAVRGEDLRISEKLVNDTVRNVLLPMWNAYSFFVTYANAAEFKPSPSRSRSSHPLDQWICAEMQDLVNRMTAQMDAYDLSATCAELGDSIDALTNWYIRLSRRRFAGKSAAEPSRSASVKAGLAQGEKERDDALYTLYDVLLTLSQTMAPFCPFITDAMYMNLVPGSHHSVHLTDWPNVRPLSESEHCLIAKNRLLRRIVSLGMSIRSEQTIKVRQPLAEATIAVPPARMQECTLTDADQHMLKQELNVKTLHFVQDPGDLAQAYAQVDARAVGPRLGAR
ncbi:class I tRNA ligase family protein, partial [Candidatus Peribacteria bacterium]|nr:class I tRNA ligase family protein [Candidatus Peribacteria bacterium]